MFTLTAVAALILVLPLHAQSSKSADPHQAQPNRQPFEILTRRMDVDVDGAPNAYGPRGSHTLDKLRDAHYRGRRFGKIVGYLTEDDNPKVPVVQGPNDPCPGDYISQTAYTDAAIPAEANPRRYVDATKINYVVLGDRARQLGARLGDFVAVTSLRTHRSVFAIVGDDGNPSGNEGSLHLLQALGYPFTNGIDESVTHREILIRFYPNSNPQHLFFHSQAELDEAARKLGLSRDFTKADASKAQH